MDLRVSWLCSTRLRGSGWCRIFAIAINLHSGSKLDCCKRCQAFAFPVTFMELFAVHMPLFMALKGLQHKIHLPA